MKYKILSTCFVLITNINLGNAQEIPEFFNDNEVRIGIIDLNDKISQTNLRIDALGRQIAKLEKEKNQLINLIVELENTTKNNQEIYSERAKKMEDVLVRFNAEIAKIEEESEASATFISNIVESVDADIYRDAITDYQLGKDPAVAIAELNKIRDLGTISTYRGPALFWIGKIQYEQGELRLARENLVRFVEGYPKDHREADAMLILSTIAKILDRTEVSTWDELILTQYPDSFAADQIRLQLNTN